MARGDGGSEKLTMALLGQDEEDLRQAIELLFFAYRDFIGEADAVLSKFGFGRAHHRAIYFIYRNSEISIGDLLGILKITKQSLSRVLTQLIAEGYVIQKTDNTDRRRRLLQLSQKGVELERQLTGCQCLRILKAIELAGLKSVSGFNSILRAMIDPNDRYQVGKSFEKPFTSEKQRLIG